MHTKITDSVFNVGVNDHLTTLFESQYPIPQGISYNSYIIMDEKIAVLDTVDERFGDEWMLNVTQALGVRKPDFLIVHHMECDHSANIERFMLMYPQAKIVLSNAALNMTKQFFANDFSDRSVIIKEGSTLELGQHTLHFIAAPLDHWPEVMMSYDDKQTQAFRHHKSKRALQLCDDRDREIPQTLPLHLGIPDAELRSGCDRRSVYRQ